MSEIVNGRRSITADTALRLARYFAMTPQFWMNLTQAGRWFEFSRPDYISHPPPARSDLEPSADVSAYADGKRDPQFPAVSRSVGDFAGGRELASRRVGRIVA
jgi:hypothetical protein